MKTVQPIRDKKKVKAMKVQLKSMGDKYYMMFILGINVGLRISDILNLKVEDVLNQNHVTIIEEKTGKAKRFLLNDRMQKEIKDYVESSNLKEDDFVVYSNKRGPQYEKKSISRIQAYRILNEAADAVGLDEIGTHTMRKTFGYHHYQQYHDVALLQDLFNHSAPSITLRYIGINQDMKDDSMRDFFL